MSRAATVSKVDLKRAIAALKAAGLSLAAVDLVPGGGFRLLIGEPVNVALPADGAGNEWDVVLSDAA